MVVRVWDSVRHAQAQGLARRRPRLAVIFKNLMPKADVTIIRFIFFGVSKGSPGLQRFQGPSASKVLRHQARCLSKSTGHPRSQGFSRPKGPQRSRGPDGPLSTHKISYTLHGGRASPQGHVMFLSRCVWQLVRA